MWANYTQIPELGIVPNDACVECTKMPQRMSVSIAAFAAADDVEVGRHQVLLWYHRTKLHCIGRRTGVLLANRALSGRFLGCNGAEGCDCARDCDSCIHARPVGMLA